MCGGVTIQPEGQTFQAAFLRSFASTMPLTDRTNTLVAPSRGSKVTVPSRYTSTSSKPTGMPCLRSQLESATRRLAERDAAEREATEARDAAETRERAAKATNRCVSRTLCAEVGRVEGECAQVSLRQEEAAAQLEAALVERDAGRTEQSRLEAALRSESETNERQAARVAELEAQLAQCHAGLATLRDTALPTAARQAEEQRQRAALAEARLNESEGRLAEREASLRAGLAHFERLQAELSAADDRGQGLGALAAGALGSFGVLHAEAGLHTDPRFCAVQDALVQLVQLAAHAEQWLPPFLAARRAELHALDLESAAEKQSEAGQQGALSPEGIVRLSGEGEGAHPTMWSPCGLPRFGPA